ncbi:hypothetical protein PHMEG_00018752 [Phytophthora megakarya]|uniref:ZSWIM1/3 RNaseH-like domain-containing protein n=1 Tax=Phytophthora megakarya TaxID=4795 RepID=A0A225VTL8_9STRA|nr:hypothetical protein PHMEG_00018752 [Phytophthora megakarya]
MKLWMKEFTQEPGNVGGIFVDTVNDKIVEHAVVQNERNPTLLTSLEEFKRNNPAWTRIKCIRIDKDFGKISLLTTAFPRP